MGRLFAPFVRGTLAFLLAGIFVITSIQSAAADEVHVVKPGETLSQIALRYGTSVASLRRLNNLPNANFVWYGQRLLINSSSAVTTATRNVGTFGTYRVRSGDSLTAVAQRHGLSVTQLAQMNGISPLRWLYNGQVLRVPLSTATVQTAPATAPVSQAGGGNGVVEGVQRYAVRPGDSITRLAKKPWHKCSQTLVHERLDSGSVALRRPDTAAARRAGTCSSTGPSSPCPAARSAGNCTPAGTERGGKSYGSSR